MKFEEWLEICRKLSKLEADIEIWRTYYKMNLTPRQAVQQEMKRQSP